MARTPDFDIRRAAELALAEAIDPPELELALVLPEIVPAQSAAELAHARCCLGVFGAPDPLPGTGSPDQRQTRH